MMKISAFLDRDSEEPLAGVADELGAVIKPEDCEPLDPTAEGRSLRDLLEDYNLDVGEIYVVSENVATIAIHALHGVLKAVGNAEDPDNERGAGMAGRDARAWALAALRELAMFDTDGIETEQPCIGCGSHEPNDSRDTCGHEHHDEPIAADPGREAVDRIRLQFGEHFAIEWPA